MPSLRGPSSWAAKRAPNLTNHVTIRGVEPRQFRVGRVWPAAIAATLVAVASACAGPGSSLAPHASGVAQSPSTSIPADASPSQIVIPPGVLFIEETHGLVLTLPPGWLGIGAGDAKDPVKLATMRAASAETAKRIDTLVDAIQKHPEYWMAAMRDSDQVVFTAQIREFEDFETWSTQQRAALVDAYGHVDSIEVSTPRKGVAFSWTNNGLSLRFYGFKRPGGAAVFTFAGRAEASPHEGWEAAIATHGRRQLAS
jgi:hypothetical protein